jgi:uncharacterized protein (TIGR04255 family)
MAGKLRLKFDNLPLVEAVVRTSFNGPKALSYQMVNAVARELQHSFPRLDEATQFEVAPGRAGTQVEIGPAYLPAAVYTGHTSGLSVSLQPDVIVTRWAKHPGLEQADYPRYESLRDALWEAVEAFRKASGDEYPGIAVVNMSYVNFIRVPNPAAVVRDYFSNDAQVGIMGDVKQVRKLEAAWNGADDVDVRFALDQASAKLPEGVTPGYRLTTAAGLRLGESTDAKSGLDRVHEVLQEFFVHLISERAKREWKLQGA